MSAEFLQKMLKKSLGEERQEMLRFLRTLAEFDAQKASLELGFSSTFDFLRRELNLSEFEASTRLVVARAGLKFPAFLQALGEGSLHLCGARLIAPKLTTENQRDVIKAVEGLSKREIESFVHQDFPVGPTAPKKDESATNDGHSAHPTLGTPEKGSKKRTTMKRESANMTRLSVSFGNKFIKSLERARQLLAHRVPGGDVGDIIEKVFEEFLKANDPEEKQKRRELRRRRAATRKGSESPIPLNSQKHRGETPAFDPGIKDHPARVEPSSCRGQIQKRSLSPEVRDLVWRRDGGRCTYVGRHGIPCGAQRFLDIDHVVPWSLGGSNEVSNLRLLCRAHHRLVTEETFGAAFIQKKSEERVDLTKK